MARRSLTCVPDHVLLRDLATLVARDRSITVELLQHLAEVDDRQLHVPAGYPSLFRYCVTELRMSEDAAYKRIQAARAARSHPGILDRIEDGRLHLTAVVMLAPHLTAENATELLEAGSHRTKSELEHLIAARFPRADAPTVLQPLTPPAATEHLAASDTTPAAAPLDTTSMTSHSPELVPEPVVPSHEPECARPAEPLPQTRPRLAPLSPERYALQVTLAKATHDKLRRAQALLSHAVPSGDIAELLDRALDALIERVEKRRHASTSNPRKQRRSKNPRHIPAHVRRAVHERDGGQCTFVSDNGRRCAEKRFLEYDHVRPVARGGQATVENTRLRCRAHNQHAAERVYGAGFMREKREAARAQGEAARRRAAAVLELRRAAGSAWGAPTGPAANASSPAGA